MKNLITASIALFVLASPTVYAADTCRAIFEGSASQIHAQVPRPETDLYFRAFDEKSRVDEHSIREGDAAAHIYMAADKPKEPYLFFAFPSGNSGVALWFKTAGDSFLQAISKPRGIRMDGGLNGAEIDLRTGVSSLDLDDQILGSLRFVRDRELGRSTLVKSVGKLLSKIQNQTITIENGKLVLTRTGFIARSKFRMEIEPLNGTQVVQVGKSYRLVSSGEVTFRARGFTNEPPLTPMSITKSFKPAVLAEMQKTAPERLVQLSFLWYKEKLMAGSPRYFSKFGRDSIYSLTALMDSLQPEAIEALLTATMSSMDPKSGQVSHEQHEGDFVGGELEKEGQSTEGSDGILEDYKMLDDDLAFAAALGKYQQLYPERYEEFMSRKEARDISQRLLTKKLHTYIEKHTSAFVTAVDTMHAETSPTKKEAMKRALYQHLISLHPGEKTGQWRDSENGLAQGRTAFDVNAVFVPAALKAMADLYGTKGPSYDPVRAEKLRHAFETWRTEVPSLFEVRVKKENLRAAGEAYFKRLGRDLSELPPTPDEDIVFTAISLDERGNPIPVMHSDDSLMMTFGYPTERYLRSVSQRLRLPFPYGLRTPLGILVANPIFASPKIKGIFGDQHYHGTVIWTMQEDLMVIGMGRQAFRKDLPADLKRSLVEDIHMVEKLIHDRGELGGIEVFSPIYENGTWVAKPFNGDAKGNSNQLWGHLRLIIPSMLKQIKLNMANNHAA